MLLETRGEVPNPSGGAGLSHVSSVSAASWAGVYSFLPSRLAALNAILKCFSPPREQEDPAMVACVGI